MCTFASEINTINLHINLVFQFTLFVKVGYHDEHLPPPILPCQKFFHKNWNQLKNMSKLWIFINSNLTSISIVLAFQPCNRYDAEAILHTFFLMWLLFHNVHFFSCHACHFYNRVLKHSLLFIINGDIRIFWHVWPNILREFIFLSTHVSKLDKK